VEKTIKFLLWLKFICVVTLLFHDIRISGNTGNKVVVELLDTEKKEFLKVEKTSNHEVPSREFIPAKHGSLIETISELEQNYPNINFEAYKYAGFNVFVEKKVVPEDVTQDSKESFIIRAKMEDRALRKQLTHKFGKKKNPLFITNTKNNALARSVYFDTEEEAQLEYEHQKTKLRNKIAEQDISLKERNGKYFLEVFTENKNMKFLDLLTFRVQRYESKKFIDKKELDSFLKELETFPNPDIIDKFSIVESLDKRKRKQYVAIASSTNQRAVEAVLSKYGFFKKIDLSGRSVLLPIQRFQDSFNLNSSTTQLRNKFPLFTVFDSTKTLDEQINYSQNPVSENVLEQRVNEIFETYKLNSCSIDLEVIDYDSEIPSGKVYMAVLNSEKENRLYITEEAWKKQGWKQKTRAALKNQNVKLVFVEDEIELIARLNKDSKKYRYVMGHNILNYDFEHLTKFNNLKKLEHRLSCINEELIKIYRNFDETETRRFALLDEAKALAKNLRRLGEVKEKYSIRKSDKLWSRPKQKILDTYPYVKNRISLLGDSKLATIAGFNKSLSYEEITKKIKSGNFNDFLEVCKYTLEDGEKSTIATNIILRNAILEAILVNKPVNSVFNTDPVMLYYEAGDRNYELTTGTYAKRHEQNFQRFIERLKARKELPEITKQFFTGLQTTSGEIQGDLIYPSLLFKTFKEILESNAIAKHIYELAKKESNILVKEDLISKLEYFLQIPIDKAKTYMERKNLVFGEDYPLEKIYNFWNAPSEKMQEIYEKKIIVYSETIGLKLDDFKEKKEETVFLSDQQFNQANMIFSIQYGAPLYMVGTPQGIRVNAVIPVKSSILKKHLERLSDAKVLAKSNSFLVLNDQGRLADLNFGTLTGVAHKNWFIGKIMDETRLYEIYQNIRKPKVPLIVQTVNAYLHESLPNLIEFKSAYFSLSDELKNKISEKERMLIKLMYRSDPFSSQEPTLFDL